MRKVYLFMLMAVGLLISTTMSAMPERPVPPEPQAPEGVEMVKPEVPEMTIPEHPALPEKGLVKKVFNSVAKAPHKAPMGEGKVAKIGTTEYATLQAAFDAAREAKKATTITMIDDATESDNLYIYGESDVTLDLNGWTITLSETNCIAVSYDGIVVTPEEGEPYYSYESTLEDKLTIVDNSQDKKGKITGQGFPIYNAGTVTISDVTIESTDDGSGKYGYGIDNMGTMTINSGHFLGVYAGAYNEGFMYINGGTIESTYDANSYYGYGIKNIGTLEMAGGVVKGSGTYAVGIRNAASTEYPSKVTVTGGSIDGTGEYGIYNDGDVEVSGTAQVVGYCGVYNTANAHIDIKGDAKINKESSNYGYGIYNDGESSSATISDNASIYGYYYGVYMSGKSSSVTISGGTLSNYGYNSSTYYAVVHNAGEYGSIEMTGGTIGKLGTYFYGNGIKNTVSSASINISGGKIDAYNIAIYNYAYCNNFTISGSAEIAGYTGISTYGKVSISGGTIKGSNATLSILNNNYLPSITGGTFGHDPKQYLTNGYTSVYNESDNTWTVVPPVVATIGETEYYSLEEALSKAKEGDEVKLLENVDGHRFIIDKAITLNLNGKTITNDNTGVNSSDPQPQDKAPFTICVSADGVVIKDGHLVVEYYWYYYSSTEIKSSAAINIEENVKNVLLKNLTIDKGNGSYGPGWCVRICENAFAKIEDGDYRGYYVNPVTLDRYTVRGTFKNKNIVPNEGWEYQDNGDDAYTLVTSAAKIKGKDDIYHTVAEAFADAQENDVIYLMTTIEEDITIKNNVNNLTLDIGNHDIEGKLTITGNDVKVDGFGTIDDLGGNVRIVRAYTKVNPTGYLADGSTFKSVDENLYRVYTDKVVYMDVKDKYYSTLADALADLPENSTPATIKILLDEQFDFTSSFYTVNQYQNVTIDLNGHKIAAATGVKGGSQIFLNYGTLIIDDSSADKDGIISNCAYNADTRTIPGYASNTIENYGTLILNNGTIENGSNGAACYCVENSISWNGDKVVCPTFIMNGGKLVQPQATAIRMYFNTVGNDASISTIIINNGEINAAAGSGIDIQHQGSNEYPHHAIITINGGKFATHNPISSWQMSGTADFCNTHITINGGDFDGYIMLGYKNVESSTTIGKEDISISGGIFRDSYFLASGHKTEVFEQFITGGIFCNFAENGYVAFQENTQNYIAEGYMASPISSSKIPGDESDGNDLVVEPRTKTVIETNTTITDPEEIKPSDIITVVGNEDEKEPITLTIGDDKGTPIEVNVNTIQGDGEAQIVVKDGAVLNVGNGGLVSNNDKLVFVKVEAGGKMTIGNKGLDQKGEIFPIIVENNTEKSGVYMVSPDAQSPTDETKYDITKPEATVRVYTRAYMTTTSEHWQHFACPVQTGVALGGGKTAVKMVPMNVTEDDPVLTVINNWNYETDKWEIMPVNGSSEYFGNAGWTTNVTMKPFYAYSLLNNSRPTDGGITYEFHGNLVGNKDMQLYFPEHGFCIFGNSYTAPIDLSVLFEKVTTDIQKGNIDPCVYIYNSNDDRFESVNALDLWMQEIGFDDAAFTQIPPQQAFIMNLTNGTTGATTVDYRKAVWGNTQNNNLPIRAPKMMSNDFTNIVRIAVKDAESTDKVTLVEGYEYDETYNHGADAQKYMDNHNFNLYATTTAGQLAMVADNNINGTILTFQASTAMEYTLSFPNVYGSDYKLIDLLTGTEIQMVEGNEYTFTAQPNSVVDRFQVVAVSKVPTAMDNIQSTKNIKGTFTILGQPVDAKKMSAGVYIVDGVKVVK